MSPSEDQLGARCFSCNSAGAEFFCSRCRRVRFCNAGCQREGWRRHKPDCSAAAPASASAARPAGTPPRVGPAGEADWKKQVQNPKTSLLEPALVQAMLGSKTKKPLHLTAYPNVGFLQGEVEVYLPEGADLQTVRTAVARCVLGGSDPSRVRLFAASGGGPELTSLEDLQREAERHGVVVSDGHPLRLGGGDLPGGAHGRAAAAAKPRYDTGLVGGKVPRVDSADEELPSLLRCPVPIVISNSGILGKAPEKWSFDYLDRSLSDVDNFFVLCAPPESNGRIAYYDLGDKKNPCGYKVAMSNERKEMRFPDFRRKAVEARKRRKAGKKAGSFYLQNTLLHREESEPGPPKPVGGFGVTCGMKVANDIRDFDWAWLKHVMGDRHPQMCQFFCGTEGDFSPCHYDPQDNFFAQVRGYKRVLLFHPRHFGCLYPWPVHHPQDRQSRVDFDGPDGGAFPRFRELQGLGLEAVLGPGEALHIPPGWWHHIEMLPSPEGEVVSINFWYPPPRWFYGDLDTNNIFWDRPIFGIRRVLFLRCVEELIGHTLSPAEVTDVIEACLGAQPPPPGSVRHDAVRNVLEFTSTVVADPDERALLLREVVEGRFAGLGPRAP